MTARACSRWIIALALAMIAVAVAACGGSSSTEQPKEKTRTVERTKVEVVEGRGRNGGFNPAAIYGKFSNGVVTVTSVFGDAKDLGDLLGGRGEVGQGSGSVLDERGFIATNAHVVTEGTRSKIREAPEVFVQFADGNEVRARIVGFDPNADVALIKVDPDGLDLVPLKLGDSSSVHVGDPVAAIGSPFGEEQSLSVGVVSATDRVIKALTDFQISDAIQTDAAINRGNSGGPLLNADGEVIGISAQIKSSSGGGEGVGFAVSVDTVKRSVGQLRKTGKARYAYVGISSQQLYPQLADRLKLPVTAGALVIEVVKGGPADDAGIEGGSKEIRFQTTLVKLGGDVIAKVNDRRITKEHDLSELITLFQPGDTVSLEIVRGGRRRHVGVKLGERPTNLPENLSR